MDPGVDWERPLMSGDSDADDSEKRHIRFWAAALWQRFAASLEHDCLSVQVKVR